MINVSAKTEKTIINVDVKVEGELKEVIRELAFLNASILSDISFKVAEVEEKNKDDVFEIILSDVVNGIKKNFEKINKGEK